MPFQSLQWRSAPLIPPTSSTTGSVLPAAGSILLVTGPSRSGKSEWAESLARASEQAVTYVATAQCDADDVEWHTRILAHRQRRPEHWRTLEIPFRISSVLAQGGSGECWLLDSLGTWLANCLEQSDADWAATQAEFLSALRSHPGTLILVAEETGWGLVPAYPLGRTFRDRLGNLTRQVGAIADAVYLVVAGYAIDLKRYGQLVQEYRVEEKTLP